MMLVMLPMWMSLLIRTYSWMNILENNGFATQILAASFKNTHQVQALCEYGVGASTVAPDVIVGFLKNDSVSAAVNAFVQDFESLCGAGKTMLNCE